MIGPARRAIPAVAMAALLAAAAIGPRPGLTTAAHAQSGERTIKIYRGASGTTEVITGVGTPAPPGAPPVSAPAKEPFAPPAGTVCGVPAAASEVVYNDEEILYDISDQEAFKSFRQVASDFDHTRKIDYKTEIADGCLGNIEIGLDISPSIHLHGFLRNDPTGCKTQTQIDSERQFSKTTADAYRALGKEIEKLAVAAFPKAEVAGHQAAVLVVEAELESSGLLGGFDAAQKKRRRAFLADTAEVSSFDDCSKSTGKPSAKKRSRRMY